MQNLLLKIADLLYENSCLICNEASKASLVCKKCEQDFIERKNNHIKRFEEITVFSWGLYEGRLREGIISLKAGKRKLADYFTNKLTVFWNKLNKDVKYKDYLVIPMPSHNKRIRERGYCQSTLIAKHFAESLNFNFSNQFATRIKETLFMNNLLNINERIENIKGAFKITDENPKENNILIIDDILTSGTTICELARAIHTKYPDKNLIGLTIASGDTYV